MRDRRRLIAVSFLICVLGLVLVPSTAQAGPLLDWLFQRNQSQSLAGAANTAASAYGSGYGAAGSSAYGAGYGGAGYGGAGYGGTGAGGGYGAAAAAANPSGGYGNAYGSTSGYRGAGGGGAGGCLSCGGAGGCAGCSLLSKCCLFGSGRGGYAASKAKPASGLAANQAAGANRTTAAYGGTGTGGSCSQGWCQQTVLKYVPQIAYRTAYQPVPVTTYKTSTTINPQNGLPRTCTRPCTSYTYQARRVPYTTYRPVYTQVPVTDDGFAGAATAAPGATAPQQPAGFAPQPNYAMQPISPNAAGGCNACQNGGGFQPAAPSFGASQYGASPYAGGVPGYTPSNSPLPPDPQAGAWGNQQLAPPTSFGGGQQPTPWRPVGAAQRGGQYYGESNGGWQRSNGSTDDYSAPDYAGQGYSNSSGQQPTDWSRVPSDGMVSPPSNFGGGGNEADRRPSLRIDSDAYYDDYSESNRSTRLKPIPMPEDIRRRLQNQPSSQFQPDNRIDGQGDTTRNNRDPYGDQYDQLSAARRETRRPQPRRVQPLDTDLDERLFSTPQRPVTTTQRRPIVSEQDPVGIEINETRRPRRRYDSRAAIQDVERIKQNTWPGDDKTATTEVRPAPRRATNQTRETITTRGAMPVYEDDAKATRYAAAPIDWSSQQDGGLGTSGRSSADWPSESNRALRWQVR